jgi:hypothetical protein
VLYRDPGFVTAVVSVTELTKELSIEELTAMLKLNALIVDIELLSQNSPKAKTQA